VNNFKKQKEIDMNTSDFLDRLYNIAGSYKWSVNNKKVLATIQSGPLRGFTLNPITALAHKSGFGLFDNTREGTEFAASFLGLSRHEARSIYSATLGSFNHGNIQVVRGRIRSTLEV
jgi:hypothetical protein